MCLHTQNRSAIERDAKRKENIKVNSKTNGKKEAWLSIE